jgi:isocitrate dehydrogenase (NAD+)
MKLGDGLFLNTFRRVAEDYSSSGIEYNDMIVDNTSMQLVANPRQFDVMVMPNLYGAIVSNIGAALVGGPGVVPGCNVGRVSSSSNMFVLCCSQIFLVKDYALFEPGCRHVAKDIMGQDRANPAAMILSATMMLRHLGSVLYCILSLILICPISSLDNIANKIASATFRVLNAGTVKTADMGGKSLVSSDESFIPLSRRAGSSTTSEFTAAVIKNLE